MEKTGNVNRKPHNLKTCVSHVSTGARDLTDLIERRRNLHRQLENSSQRIDDLEKQLQATQKLAAIGTMACLIAHEFKNILSPIINYAELAQQNPEDVELTQKALAKVIKHGNNASTVVQSLLGVVTRDNQNFETVPLKTLFDECFQALARNFEKDNIVVNTAIPEDLMISVVPGLFQQVIMNLVINARQAMLPGGGSLHIRAEQVDAVTKITIADTGCGIAEEQIDRIFQPFYTTKSDADRPDLRGTGLGLPVCLDIIESHKGTISLNSEVGKGTTFTINLPESLKNIDLD